MALIKPDDETRAGKPIIETPRNRPVRMTVADQRVVAALVDKSPWLSSDSRTSKKQAVFYMHSTDRWH